MKRVSFRKVYGYRDPESKVVEIPPVGIYECIIQAGNSRDDKPLDLMEMFGQLYEIRRVRELQNALNPRYFYIGSDAVYVIEGFSGPDIPEPVTQSKIDRVFELGKHDKPKDALAMILEKAQRHL